MSMIFRSISTSKGIKVVNIMDVGNKTGDNKIDASSSQKKGFPRTKFV